VRIIFGIGNPGNKYKYNRHNVGFMFLNYFANSLSLSFAPSKSEYYFAEGELNDQSFALIKPSTFVNNSGIAALEAIQNYNIDVKDFLFVYDDLNLEFPSLRAKVSGGDGGHNGLNSVIYHLASEDFPRLRFGIGNNFEKGKMAEYVLTDFDEKEMVQLKSTFDEGIILTREFIRGGTKNLLDANSILSKNKNSVNLSTDSKSNSEKS
jgi:peptidyl-tRNA hydrolase, PTH1 family